MSGISCISCMCTYVPCEYVFETENEDDSLFMLFFEADADAVTVQCAVYV